MDFQLEGRRVLVTGGSRGIGRAVALAFAREGARPVLVSRAQPALDEAAAFIAGETGITPETLAFDLGRPGAVDALAAQCGEVDVLVNNAGAIPAGSIHDIDDATWRAAWELKLFGYIHLTRRLLPHMEARGHGVIVNIIGMAGAAPRADYICGATANAALMAFTRAAGAASPKHGVRIFGINPAMTRSDRMETMMRKQAEARLGDAARWPELTTGLPFGRAIEPAEIAELAVFGASPRGGYLSGTVIDVDGGQMFAGTR